MQHVVVLYRHFAAVEFAMAAMFRQMTVTVSHSLTEITTVQCKLVGGYRTKRLPRECRINMQHSCSFACFANLK